MKSHTSKPRIVVTGIGVTTSLGKNIHDYWENLINGKSGINHIQSFDISSFPSRIGAEILDFEPSDYMDPKDAKRTDRYSQLGIASAMEALKDAGLKKEDLVPDRTGVMIGTGIGGMSTVEVQSKRFFEGGARKVSPFMIPSIIANMASGLIAIELGARGPNFSAVSACASSTHAIGEALRKLEYGDADIIFAGGAEAAVTALGYAGFCAMRAMSTEFNDTPEKASRPFDKNRDGFVMGEGAAVLTLETLDHALARNAKIYCELSGYSATCDAYHITSPHPEGYGLSLCLETALRHAGAQPHEVDYINAHGTSTPYNDKFETLTFKKVFGEHAHKLAISSTKSMTGHLLGAAGAIEMATLAKAIQTGIVPPTINYETPDPDCDLDYVPNKMRKLDINVGISDNLGFGGQNACLVAKKFKD